MKASETTCPSKSATNIAIVANELITNALKHGAPGSDGKLQISIESTLLDDSYRLAVWSSGVPLPADFDFVRQSSLGLRLVQDLVVGQYGGTFILRADGAGNLAETVIPAKSLR